MQTYVDENVRQEMLGFVQPGTIAMAQASIPKDQPSSYYEGMAQGFLMSAMFLATDKSNFGRVLELLNIYMCAALEYARSGVHETSDDPQTEPTSDDQHPSR